MQEESISFYSAGVLLRGMFRTPDEGAALTSPLPTIVQGPGWLGLASGQNYRRWHESMTDAGYAVLIFDYRGFGESDGERGWIRPDWQVEDILNAVTYLKSREDVDSARIAAYGMGGTGGGNAVMAAGLDERIKCVVAQSVVADGADWLHRMRREYEWIEYQQRLAEDKRKWVTDGEGERVHPREELMIETPERRKNNPKKDVDSLMPTSFFLRSAEYIIAYRPIDVVSRISPRALLMTSVEDDVVTPPDHAEALYERAKSPKRLVRQYNTTHYLSYRNNFDYLIGEVLGWYKQHLEPSDFGAIEE